MRALIDDLLEITVIGSFSRIGPLIRRRLFGWTDPPPGALRDRTVLVTGPTSGLGLEVARTFAALGARLVLVGRNEAKLDQLRSTLIADHGEDRFPIVVADMSSLASVRAAVAQVLATESRLDVVVDNAGAIYPERQDGPDGIEATLALLAVGPFALEAGLLPLLRDTPGSRVIAVTSGGMYAQRLPLDDLEWHGSGYSGPLAYARAKRAQVVLMREWARRVPGTEVAFAAMHPGWTDTTGVAESLPGFYRVMKPLLRSPAEGADTIFWLATAADPAAIDGRLFLDRRARPFDRLPSTRLDAAARRRVWDAIAQRAGVGDSVP